MSDGPHKSLPMRRGWKRLAKRADTKAFSPDEVADALPAALGQDWAADVQPGFTRRLQDILVKSDDDLFGDRRIDRLNAERADAAGRPLAGVLIDCLIHEIDQGRSGDDALKEAAANALSDRAARGARQVEEHYQRESGHRRADRVRGRLEAGVAMTDMRSLAQRLLGAACEQRVRAPARQDGLDDGVRL